ncbi:class I SAM-dependent methyltransferase [Okeania sp. SIO1I7]|uniref:class I SAM-dependent methyltransferase n=1 Tax=Okeania sp. SIO1I7 TaxID=2607772 RepID=UPI0013FBA7E8|nr:methyltransferase domain-containing protein [Okeania sp. SIO1I7]NET24407.1 methyltransferase domain-containing protein [Okeania sp. SIO1I7]
MHQLNLNNYKQEIADLYTRRSDKYDNSDWHWRIANRLVEYGQVDTGQKILDIATGTGHCAIAAAKLVGSSGKVIGIDIAPGMITKSQKKANIFGLNNLEFLLADAENIDFPANHFERIFCASAFIWISDLVKSLLLWRKFLKPGGILGIQAFAETAFVGGVITQNILKKYGISYLMSQPTGTVEKCKNLLQKASFELIEIKVEKDGNYISLESAKKMWAGKSHPAPGQYPHPLSKLSTEELNQAKLEFENELKSLQTDQGIWNDITTFYIYGRKPKV